MKKDRRVEYTKMVLRQSLLELMRENPISKITVTGICEKAEVNRGTFYAHYKDPYDLLEQIENELFEDIYTSIDAGFKAESIADLLTDICTSIVENGELCKIVLSGYENRDFLDRVINIAHDYSIENWKNHIHVVDEIQLERLYSFYAHGSAAIIRDWVLGGMKESPREIALFLEKISNLGPEFIKD